MRPGAVPRMAIMIPPNSCIRSTSRVEDADLRGWVGAMDEEPPQATATVFVSGRYAIHCSSLNPARL